MKNPQQQFTAAYNEYSDSLFRYCLYKTSNRETSKDIIQETFYRAWRHMRRGQHVDNIKAFLYKILGNLIIDQYRKRPADESLEIMHEDGFDPGIDDTDRWINSMDGRRAVDLLDDIREPYRETIAMRYLDELSIGEIAGRTHASENAVAVRIHRGLRSLQKLFEHVATS